MPRETGGWDGVTNDAELGPVPGEAADYTGGQGVAHDDTNDWYELQATASTVANVRWVANDQTVDTDGDQLIVVFKGKVYVLCDATMENGTDVVLSGTNAGQVEAYDSGSHTVDQICGRMREEVDSTTEYFLMKIKE